MENVTEDNGQNPDLSPGLLDPKEVDPDTIDARYRSGVLSVTLPIEEEDAPYGGEIEVKP